MPSYDLLMSLAYYFALHIYLFIELFKLSRVFFSMRQVISRMLGSSDESRSLETYTLVSPFVLDYFGLMLDVILIHSL